MEITGEFKSVSTHHEKGKFLVYNWVQYEVMYGKALPFNYWISRAL